MRRQLLQGAEIGPRVELEKVGETTGRLRKRVSWVSYLLVTHLYSPCLRGCGCKGGVVSEREGELVEPTGARCSRD